MIFLQISGPRRIFTKRPVDERYLVHSVQFGRHGRKGWLQVDSFANITGKAPGSREIEEQLDLLMVTRNEIELQV